MRRNWRNLTNQDLQNILEEWEDSEDGFDFSDDDDVADPKFIFETNEYEDPEEPPDLENEVQAVSSVASTSISTELIILKYIGSGQENKYTAGEPDLGASSNVVVRLARDVPTNQNYRLFFDNYYTSIPLIEYLSNRGILALGTIRKNRIPNCKLPDEKVFKKKPRGTSVEQVGNSNGVDVAVVTWRDNKIVNLASNFAGKHPTSVVRRWDRSNKQYISVDRPFVVAEYNRHMGGVDLLDCVMGHYKMKLRSKHWYLRIFYHFLDMAMCNSWLLYRRIMAEKGSTSKTLNSADFRVAVAETLCKYKTISRTKRKSDVECLIQEKKKKGPAQHVPPKDVRVDQYGHWPVWVDTRMRCKFPGCKRYFQQE